MFSHITIEYLSNTLKEALQLAMLQGDIVHVKVFASNGIDYTEFAVDDQIELMDELDNVDSTVRNIFEE